MSISAGYLRGIVELQLKNSKGKTGWFLNPGTDSKRPNGYFKEAFFAG